MTAATGCSSGNRFAASAESCSFCTAGCSRPIRIAMIAMTTSRAVRVKPRERAAVGYVMVHLRWCAEIGNGSKSSAEVSRRRRQLASALVAAVHRYSRTHRTAGHDRQRIALFVRSDDSVGLASAGCADGLRLEERSLSDDLL